MTHLSIDFEWRSPLDIRKVGLYRVIDDPRTEIICFAARWPVHVKGLFYTLDWDTLPPSLQDAVLDERLPIIAHNATVERLVMQRIMHKRHGWPWVPNERFRCSAARVARLGLPRALDKAGAALRAKVQKDAEGHRIMMRVSKPIGSSDTGFIYDTAPHKIEKLGNYCATDVDAEEEIIALTIPMPEGEEDLYQLTESINDRGVRVDVNLVHQLIWQAEECIDEINRDISHLTDGAVRKVTDDGGMKRWLKQEIDHDGTLRKEDVDALLEGGGVALPVHVRQVLEIRREGRKAAVAKLFKILDRVSRDGRIHGEFVFNGASTGRYTSNGVQLQNLVRDTHKDFDTAIKSISQFTLRQVSQTIRQCFIPADGCVFIDADYNAIEARGVAWLAGAKDLIAIYTNDGDPYCEMGTAIYNRTITKADADERFVGKQTILGCGYGMGWRKFLAQCEKFGQPVTEEMAQKAVATYRSEFPEIPALWYEVTEASMNAVRKPGLVTYAALGKLQFVVKNGYLRMRLPSGRCLFYKSPRIDTVWKFERDMEELTFMAENPKTHQWMRESTWGGKLVENAVQAMCRDLLFDAMWRIERDRNIPIVLSVHDQIVCEVPEKDGQRAVKIVQHELETLPRWADGFPVKAEPNITKRFGK